MFSTTRKTDYLSRAQAAVRGRMPQASQLWRTRWRHLLPICAIAAVVVPLTFGMSKSSRPKSAKEQSGSESAPLSSLQERLDKNGRKKAAAPYGGIRPNYKDGLSALIPAAQPNTVRQALPGASPAPTQETPEIQAARRNQEILDFRRDQWQQFRTKGASSSPWEKR